MTAVPENILQKIRKLLTLGQSENASEAANAMGAAQKLMDEHRLTSAQIPGEKHTEAFHIDEANPLIVGGKLTFWKNLLLAGIMGENGCTWYMQRRWNRDRVVPGRGLGDLSATVKLDKPSRGPQGVSDRDPDAKRAGTRAGWEVEIHKALEEPAQAKAPALGSGT